MLMVAYPRSYLDRREEEIVATLLETASPGQTRPTVRDAVDLVRSGVVVRANGQGREARCAGRSWAAAMATFVVAMVATLVVAMRSRGFWSDVSAASIVALWAPLILIPVAYVVRPAIICNSAGRVIAAMGMVGVVVGPDSSMVQRSVMGSLVVLAGVITLAPAKQVQKRTYTATRWAAMVIGAIAGAGLAVRRTAATGTVYDRGATNVWGALPHPPSLVVSALLAIAFVGLILCMIKPAAAIAVGLVAVPSTIIGVQMSSDATFFTLQRTTLVELTTGCLVAASLVAIGTTVSLREMPIPPAGSEARATLTGR